MGMRTSDYKKAIKKMGHSAPSSAKLAKQMYTQLKYLQERDISVKRTSWKKIDDAYDRQRDREKAAARQTLTQKRMDVEYVKKNIADKKGYVYLYDRKDGEWRLKKTTAEKYARLYKDKDYDEYRITNKKGYEEKYADNQKDWARGREREKEDRAKEEQISKVQAQLKASGFEGSREQALKTKIVSSATMKKLKEKEAVKKGKTETLKRDPSKEIKNWDKLTPAIQKKVKASYATADTAKIESIQKEVKEERKKSEWDTRVSVLTGLEASKERIELAETKAKVEALEKQATVTDKVVDIKQPSVVEVPTAAIFSGLPQSVDPTLVTKTLEDKPVTLLGPRKELVSPELKPVITEQPTVVIEETIGKPSIKDKIFGALKKTPTGYVYGKTKDYTDKIFGTAKDKLKPVTTTLSKTTSKLGSLATGIVATQQFGSQSLGKTSMQSFLKSTPFVAAGGMSAITGAAAKKTVPKPVSIPTGGIYQTRYAPVYTPTFKPLLIGGIGKDQMYGRTDKVFTGLDLPQSVAPKMEPAPGYGEPSHGPPVQRMFPAPKVEPAFYEGPRIDKTIDKTPTTFSQLVSTGPAAMPSYMPQPPASTVSYLSEDTMRKLDPEYDNKKAFKEAQTQLQKDLSEMKGYVPEEFQGVVGSLLIGKKREYRVAQDVVPELLGEKIEERAKERDLIGQKLVSEYEKYNTQNAEFLKIKNELDERENVVVDKYGLYTKEVYNPDTNKYEVKYGSEKGDVLLDEYNRKLSVFEDLRDEKSYYEMKEAGLKYENFNSQYIPEVTDLNVKQSQLFRDVTIASKDEKRLSDLKFKYDELDYNVNRLNDEASAIVRELGEVDKFAIASSWADRMAKGEFVEATGKKGVYEARQDWLKGELAGVGLTLAKGGRGLTNIPVEGYQTGLETYKSYEPSDITKKQGELAVGLDKIGTTLGKALKGTVYQPGARTKIAKEQYGVDKSGYYSKWGDVDWESALAASTVATVGLGSAAAGTATGGKAILGGKGLAYAGQVGKFVTLGKVVPKGFTETSMYVGTGKLGGEEGKQAVQIFEKDRGLFTDAMRAGYAEEKGYVQEKQAAMEKVPVVGWGLKKASQVWEEIPTTPIISARMKDEGGIFKGEGERKDTFKKGVFDYYKKQGYSVGDASLMSEVAWGQRESGMAGEGVAVGVANIGTEAIGRRFLHPSLKSIAAKPAGKYTFGEVAKITGKSAWHTAKAGVLEGVAVGGAKQSGRYEAPDYDEVAVYGAGGFVSAGIIGGILGASTVTGSARIKGAVEKAVYITDPWEKVGDVAEEGIRKGLSRKTAKTLTGRMPVMTQTWGFTASPGSAAETMFVSPKTDIIGPSVKTTTKAAPISVSAPASIVDVSTPTFIDSFTMPTSIKSSVKIPGMASSVTQPRSSPFVMATTDTSVDIDEKIQTMSSLRDVMSGKIRRGTNIFGFGKTSVPVKPGVRTSVDVPPSPYVEELTRTSVTVRPTPKPSPDPTPRPSPDPNVPPDVPTQPDVPVDPNVPTDVTTYVNVPAAPFVGTGGGVPYLKGGWGADAFGFGFGAMAGGWNVGNKIKDIAGEWLEGQKQKDVMFGALGTRKLPTFGSMPTGGFGGAGGPAQSRTIRKMISTGIPATGKSPMLVTSRKLKPVTKKKAPVRKITSGVSKTKLTTKKKRADTRRVAGYFKR